MQLLEVELSDSLVDWIEQRIADGKFADASEYVRHLIEQDQRWRAAVTALQVEITKGIESGIAGPFDPDAFNREMVARHFSEKHCS